jgi:hypothetical protein
VELPLGKALAPVKVASFSYSPEQVQAAAAGVDVLEQHRMAVCAYLGFLEASDRAKRVDKLIEEEGYITALALVLRTDSTKVGPLINSIAKTINSSIAKDDGTVSKSPALRDAIERFSGSNPGTPAVLPVSARSPRWELANDIRAGDCTLHSGSFVEVSSTTARYSLVTSTRKSGSGDVWHHYWKGRDAQGLEIVSIGPVNSDGAMYPIDGKRTSTGTAAIDGADALSHVVDVVWKGQC